MKIEEEINDLCTRLTVYQDAYYKKGESLVSDSEYDRLWDRLKALEEEYPEFARPDSPTLRVGSDLSNDFPEVRHSIPVLSLDKAYHSLEVLSFFSKSIEKEGERLSFVAEEKIDGVSMVLYYENGLLVRAVTRGNGEVGNDVTLNMKTVKSVPLRLKEPLNIAVRGEVFLSKEDFKRFNATLDESEQASNARNSASGAIRRQKASQTAAVPLDMFCYEGFWNDKNETPENHLMILSKLKELGFHVNPHLAFFSRTQEEAEKKLKDAKLDGLVYSFDQIQDYIDYKTEEREKLEYEIDGLVFKINELDVREKLGYTEHHPRWAIAYKFVSPQAQAVLNSIVCQVGRTGRITPVAEFSPTRIGGSVVSRATLHNQEYIDELELAIGDTVSITKRGDVIPAVEEVVEKNNLGNTTYKMPKICPSCGSPLIKEGAHEFCPNYNCAEQAKGRITYFASRDQMDIETLGPKMVETLYDLELVKTIEDIYSADYSPLVGLPGIGEKTIDALKKGIEESKTRPYKTVLASLGIAEIGNKNATLLSENGFSSLSSLIDASEKGDKSVFTGIKGIGEETAAILIDAFRDERLRATIASLTQAGLHTDQRMDEVEEGKEAVFSGQVWVITGSFKNFNPRSKALAEIEKRGGRTASSVTGKTTHLLQGEGGGSKRAEAEKLGVRIVTEDEFLQMLGREKVNTEEIQGMLF